MKMFGSAFEVVLGTLLVGCASVAQATESGDIEGAFRSYWDNFSSARFEEAAQFICSDELVRLKSDLLPVLVSASSGSDADGRRFANSFFAGISPLQSDQMSGKDVFVHLSDLFAASDASFSHFKDAQVRDVHVSIDSEDLNRATLKIEMAIGDVPMTDMNEAKKTGSGWCLLLRESPKATASKLKRVFRL
jgi:hypothetical protein